MTIRIHPARALALGSLLLAALPGCGGGEGGGPGGGGGFAFPPTVVETAEVALGGIVDDFRTVGSIEARETIEIVSEIDAIVTALPFEEGGAVRAGDPLVLLDDAEARAELRRAEARREQAAAAHARVERVVADRAAAPQDLDDAVASLHVAEADVALARARLAKTRIVAPFSGVVGAREVSPGAFLRAGRRVTDLSQIDEVKVSFSAPERYVSRLNRGARVTISTTAYPGEVVEGTIDIVEPVLDSATRNLQVVARVPNPEGKLRPGMSADVAAVLSSRVDAITIPSEAVFAEGDQFLVYVVGEDSTVARAELVLGTRRRGDVEVLGGLEPGQRVVRAGHQKLYPGAKVAPVPPEGPAGGGSAP